MENDDYYWEPRVGEVVRLSTMRPIFRFLAKTLGDSADLLVKSIGTLSLIVLKHGHLTRQHLETQRAATEKF